MCSKNHGISSHWWEMEIPDLLLGERNPETLENREKLTLVMYAGDEILPRLSNYIGLTISHYKLYIKMLVNQSI